MDFIDFMDSSKHIKHIVGIDEAGRGPLAGPVAVGVFCINTEFADKKLKKFSRGFRDSKKMTPRKREEWFEKLKMEAGSGSVDFFVAFASASLVDRRGIMFAINHALRTALFKLNINPEHTLVLLDGSLHAPEEFLYQETIIGGDDTVPVIAFASIAAKVTRDRLMVNLGKKHKGYGFEKHKGYGTREHYAAIEKFGVLKNIHRKSFLKSKTTKNNGLVSSSALQSYGGAK